MLDTLFLQIFDMTKVASLVILVVLLVRLCLKRAPKVFSYALWAVVLFRLLCPVSIEAPISLIPTMESTAAEYSVSPTAEASEDTAVTVETGFAVAVDPSDNQTVYAHRDTSQVFHQYAQYNGFTLVWLCGIAVMLVYSGVSYGKLRRKLLASVKVRDNIYIADDIDSPFVMGLFRPKIYLPSTLAEKEQSYIILHEQHHIRRGDHIIKLLSFAALCLHWFNPLVWVAFILSGKDMEMSCDEAVLRKLGEDIRVDYSASLISLATGRRIIAGTPLAFGEGNTEGRIKNIAKWKKPAVWVIVIAVIVCVVLAVCLITNPMNRDTQLWGAEYRIEEILYRTSDEFDHADNDSASICITADYCLYVRDTEGNWDFVGQMEPYTLDKDELAEYTAYDDGWLRHFSPGEITDSYIMRMNVTEYEAQLYLAFKTKKGDTLLGVGVEDISERGQGASDDTALHVLLRLEATSSVTNLEAYISSLDSAALHEYLENNLENAYPEYHMVSAFEIMGVSPDELYLYAHIAEYDGNHVGYNRTNFPVVLYGRFGYGILEIQSHAIPEDGVGYGNSMKALFPEKVRNEIAEKEAAGGYHYLEKAADTRYEELLNIVQMTPTTANIVGAFDGYLYVPMDGANYRYEIIFDDPASVTPGKLMYQFTEEADPSDVDWRVYAVDDYPDLSVVLAEAGDDYVQLYRYSPSKAVDPALLDEAKEDGKIVLEDGYATSGQALWNTFYKLAGEGKHISADIVHYHTMENGNYDGKYYEAYKEDYPAMYEFELTHEGGIYTMKWNECGTEYVRTYKYLRKFEDVLPTQQSFKEPQTVTRYVLTNNNTASWDELWRSLASSQLGDFIDHYTIYSEKN